MDIDMGARALEEHIIDQSDLRFLNSSQINSNLLLLPQEFIRNEPGNNTENDTN